MDYHSLNYYITENGNEVDFVFQNTKGQIRLVQICWNLTDESYDGEVGALTEAMSEFDLKIGYIITETQNKEISVNLDSHKTKTSGQSKKINLAKFK